MQRATIGALAAILIALLTAGPASAARLSSLDEHYLKSSAQGDIFEITGAKIALRKSHNRAVRKLASTLLSDHSKSLKETIAMASPLGVKLPSSAQPPQIWELA